ncbi:MAG: nickel pincer cofactor biosynthesis protein LarC [Pseudomonadota bacterium]
MRALFYQPNCGLSGDMHLAAIVDLGVPAHHIEAELRRLPITSEYSIELQAAAKMGIHGTRARVDAQDQHDHRHHSTIVKMIREAKFASGIERRALDIFAGIAAAEGKIHNVPPEDVHFHEVGAIDSIVDIVAAAIGIEYLAPDIILCGPVEVGSGYVDCAHGRFPVPAPATQELLTGAPCTYGGVQGESTTPTGAAILSASVTEYAPKGTFAPERIGYGVGHKDFERPNVLRVAIGEYEMGAAHAAEHFQIEANIDDMNPEAYEPLFTALFDAGAVDVYVQPIVMKKSRPAHTLVALCSAQAKDAVADCILNHSSTIGLRMWPFDKRVLPRSSQSINTSLGAVQIKQVQQPNGETRWKIEHDDIAKLAQQHGLSYLRVQEILQREVAAQRT